MSRPVVVVTGGGQGIGLAICERLAHEGTAVAIVDIEADRAADAAQTVGHGAIGLAADVTNFEEMSDAGAKVRSELGAVTGVVANQGWTPEKRFLDTTLEEQARIIAVNFTGSLHTTRVFLPEMVEAGRGRVVLISSDAARVGVAGEAVYAGAKAALIGFAKSLAVEVGRSGITVNVVCPGSTDTPLLHTIFSPEQIEKRIEIHPMRRLAKPEDIAATVAFFLSDDAGFVNGQVLSVSGGMLRAG